MPPQLLGYIDALRAGTLTNDEIFYSQGHGALVLDPHPGTTSFLATTGPRQALLAEITDPYHAVPHGAMMQAGCFGLLRAVAAHFPEHRDGLGTLGALEIAVFHERDGRVGRSPYLIAGVHRYGQPRGLQV